jgi:hypothetical protein
MVMPEHARNMVRLPLRVIQMQPMQPQNDHLLRRHEMNLQSCDSCGSVLDIDKLIFPDQKDWWKEDGSFDETLAGWVTSANDWRAKVPCPVCKSDIFENTYD